MARYQFGRHTIMDGVTLLGEIIAKAGVLADRLQPSIAGRDDGPQQKGGNTFASALTDADLILQTFVGVEIALTFEDVRFMGEEGEKDLISKHLNRVGSYIITLDPVNSTRYYWDGLPHYEVVATVCTADWKLIGTAIALPAHHGLLKTWRNQDGKVGFNQRSTKSGAPCPFIPAAQNTSKELLLGTEFAEFAPRIRDLGLTPVFPWRDYTGEKDWRHPSSGALLGSHAGCVSRDTSIIDGGAFAFAGECMGGTSRFGRFHPETLRYDYVLAARDESLANDLMKALEL